MSEESPSSIATHFAGPIFCGAMVCQLFTGFMLMQLQVYIRRFKDDSLLIKCLVSLVSAMAVVNAGLISYASYDQTILHFGDVQALYGFDKPFDVALAMLVFPSTFVQLFFAWRVKRLTGRNWVLAAVVVAAAAQWAMMSTVVYFSDTMGKGKEAIEVFVIIWWSLSLATDILITINLAIFFHYRRTGFTGTDDILSRLNRLTIQNGGVISLWAVLLLIFWTTTSDNASFAFVIPFPALYVISLLSSLNSRHITSNGIHWSDDTPWSNSISARRRTGTKGLQSQIQVTRTVEEASDVYQLSERDTGSNPRRITRNHGGGRIPSTHLLNMTQNNDSSPEDRDMDLESEIGKGDLELTSEELRVKLSAAVEDTQEVASQYEKFDGSQHVKDKE
ncbi:hypothetical protein DL93DRAFT_1837541 [Clavulina sp. PMI_390]|nr:hypothetical protein DL93DRAFT_1837541 [Clavulina sp. PMI_390]